MIRIEITVQPGKLLLEKKLLRQTLRAAGSEVAALARSKVRSSSGSGRTYSRKGRRWTASAPGQSPVSVTGGLATGFKVSVFKSGEGVAIRDRAFYSKMLEGGAFGGGPSKGKSKRMHRLATAQMRAVRAQARGQVRVLKPRPFLSTALEERQVSIAQRIAVSINSGMKFEKMPVRKIKPSA